MENNEIRDDEVISVEPGMEDTVKTVEEEIAEVTPTEEPTEAATEEEVSEAPKEEAVEEENKEEDSSSDTTSSENPSEENENEKEEKIEEEPTEPPTEEVTEAPSEEPSEKSEVDELEKAKAELEELKEAEATRQIVEQINKAAIDIENEVARFDNNLSKALEDTFKQYGIELNVTLEELKEKDPAKHAIAVDLINHAENIRAQKIAEMQAPLVQAQKAYVFREASKAMCEYEMTDEQAEEAANTFVNIMNSVGILNVGEDLRAKVELAVARAKMIAPKVDKVVEEVKEIVEDTKEAIKDVIEETAQEDEKPSEDTPEEEVTEAPSEAPVVDIEAFKESATTGDAIVNNREGVTVDNVLNKLSSLPFRARTEFYKKYADLIREAGIQQFKNQGLR